MYARYHLAASRRAEKFSSARFPRFSHVRVLKLFKPPFTTATATGATWAQTAELGADAGHVKIKRAAALVPDITHLPDWNISLHDTHADRNRFDNRIIIGSQLRDWMVNPTTNVTFMIYNGGEGVDVPIELIFLTNGGGRSLCVPPNAECHCSGL